MRNQDGTSPQVLAGLRFPPLYLLLLPGCGPVQSVAFLPSVAAALLASLGLVVLVVLLRGLLAWAARAPRVAAEPPRRPPGSGPPPRSSRGGS